jgi:methylenetetrahydrofolate dehydrogenase (NADP+) / methenyltetrahydrofolate cyclohydrolase
VGAIGTLLFHDNNYSAPSILYHTKAITSYSVVAGFRGSVVAVATRAAIQHRSLGRIRTPSIGFYCVHPGREHSSRCPPNWSYQPNHSHPSRLLQSFIGTMNEDVARHKIIDGKQIAATIREEIRLAVSERISQQQMVPGLAVVLVGNRRDSQTYVNMKKKACKEAGIVSTGYDFAENVTEEELLHTIHELNNSPDVHGILIQLPLPVHLNQDVILRAVDPAKDVDGLHPVNTAALQIYNEGNAMQAPFSIPCTPLGCLELLDRTGIELSGKHCVVIGRSQLVGLPMARLLLGRNATVTICHSKTVHPASIVSQADVVVVAIGRPELVTADWIKPGAVVIDVGINSVDVAVSETSKKSYRLVGDVKYDDCVSKCTKITPVPGGVGPMTIAMLLRNTLRSCERMTTAM